MASTATDVVSTAVFDVTIDTRKDNTGPVLNGQTGPSSNAPNTPDSDVMAEDIQKKKREQPPLRYCRFIVDNPKLAFGKTSAYYSPLILEDLSHRTLLTIYAK